MEKQSGVALIEVWDQLSGFQRSQIVEQIAKIEKILASFEFLKFGSLYYKQDLPRYDEDTALYIDENGEVVHSDHFGVGPTCHRSFFDFGKGSLRIDRGPCKYL